jgi:nitroreductase
MMVEFNEVLEKRRSVRAYKDAPVEKAQVDRIITAVMACPTAGNLQAYRILVVTDKEKRGALAAAALGQRYVAQAPVVLVFSACADDASKYGRRGRELYALQDATIAMTYAHLAATAEGLGSVWIGAFDPEKVSKALDLPASLLPVAMLPIGHPADKAGKRKRKPTEEIVQYEK